MSTGRISVLVVKFVLACERVDSKSDLTWTHWCNLDRPLTPCGQRRAGMTDFWKSTEQFRGSRRETLDGGRKKKIQEDTGKECHESSVTKSLRDEDGKFFSNKSLWLGASLFHVLMKAPLIHSWERGRSVSADSCREQGRETWLHCAVLLSVCLQSVFFCSYLKLKPAALTSLSAGIQLCFVVDKWEELLKKETTIAWWYKVSMGIWN